MRKTEIAHSNADKKAVLVVSFGTSYNDTRAVTLDAIENAVAAALSEFELRRAYTSGMVIRKLKSRDNLHIDSVEEAMQRLLQEGFSAVLVQPTHVINGFEYDDMLADIAPFKDKFKAVLIGGPLLFAESDFIALAKIIAEQTASYLKENAAVALMGHGTEHAANAAYHKLGQIFSAEPNTKNIFVGTVEGTPTLADVMQKASASGVKRVILLPLMIVAGDHACNDMAGDEEDSWKTQFEGQGYTVQCILKGLGEHPQIQELFIRHALNALDGLEK